RVRHAGARARVRQRRRARAVVRPLPHARADRRRRGPRQRRAGHARPALSPDRVVGRALAEAAALRLTFSFRRPEHRPVVPDDRRDQHFGQHYIRGLGLSTRNNALAYGYSIAISGAFFVLERYRHSPSLGEIFLFLVGAALPFAVLNAALT